MSEPRAHGRDRLDAYIQLTRLNRPIGILLLLWPTLWGVWLASGGHPDPGVLAVFVLGTVLMRSAGCVINDYADRGFDPHVARTKLRPLAAGRVTPGEALRLFAVLVALSFLLVLTLRDALVVAMSVPALFLAASYPFTKRFFAIPQAYLGIAFGFGIPMAFAAELGSVPPVAWVLVLANVFWAVAYDTEYAMVDRADDLKIGMKTSAITFGRFDVLAVGLCYAATLAVLAAVGRHFALGAAFYAGLAVAGGIAIRHLVAIRGRDPARCFWAFLHNNWLGASVFAGIALDAWLRGAG